MVVSKDSKRKRKESPPPQPPMIESSPEMPKRTKVQAQRKFAQGQSAPTSSYTAALAASSSSTTGGPSASSESREPPTEILPNKRPKTEDFLTFLCFRGTSALPAHLDFLNQGKPVEPEKIVDKKKSKATTKTKKKPIAKKGGKQAKVVKETAKAADDEPVASTSAAAAAAALLAENNNSATNNNPPPESSINDKSKNQNEKREENQTDKTSSIPLEEPISLASPTKKAATAPEPAAEPGNRRSRAANEKSKAEVLTTKTADNKRRSNRTIVKDMKHLTEPDAEEDNYEQLSANGAIEQLTESKNLKEEQNTKKSKTPTQLDNQTTSTPTQEHESSTAPVPMPKGKKNKATVVKNISTEIIKQNIGENEQVKESQIVAQKVEQLPAAIAKAKQPVKRTRQKESPIFIPSPEPTGRMTRQRAFFEPVKVLPRDNVEETEQQSDKNLKSPPKDETVTVTATATGATATTEKPKKLDLEIEKSTTAKKIEDTKKTNPEIKPEEKNNSLNVFDFSSEDEQPLSKSIKLKKDSLPVSPKKTAQNVKRKGKKLTQKKPIPHEAATIETEKKENMDLRAKTIEEQKDKGKEKDKEKESEKETEKETEKEREKEIKKEKEKEKEREKEREKEVEKETIIEQNDEKTKRGVGKSAKKKQTAAETETPEVAKPEKSNATTDETPAPLAKKTPPSARQPRKLNKAKCDPITPNGTAQNEESDATSPTAPVRSQRPSRKTKEAAAIYMGIIGHKLQQNEDEDDELSLNSFPDLPNVKETEKMEFELKKNAVTTSNSPTTAKSPSKSPSKIAVETEKQAPVPRRGRPPKQGKPPPPPAKREIEGMLIKKGALAKVITINTQSDMSNNDKQQLEDAKVDEEEEDFLLNEEVNETKRKLEKSFSDSDDEPLAVKVNLKSSDKDVENDSRKSDSGQRNKVATTLTMLPIDGGAQQVAVSTPPVANATGNLSTNTSPITAANTIPQNASQSLPIFFKVTEKKSPIPNAKILNVPAAYTLPATTQNSYINKMEHKLISPNLTSSYLPPASPHYHIAHTSARPSPHPALQTAKSPTQPPPLPTLLSHIAAPPPPPQSPLKYQTPPTTYPPPIEAYPSPKINPNFLTPKFDRSALPRTNNFPSPSPVKFDLSSSTTKTGGIANSTLSPKTLPTIAVGSNTVPGLATTPTTSSAALAGAAAGANASSDPLKDEIGSILAANLMPSKEESGKIFGIASVSLAQSSGPDNTKCTLGKCGSIHKPVLGPVVPTEGYIGDQLSSKERRKAKVNMTHEQIQKWLIECSSNPDEIQDDLDDDYDDNLRPNLFATTPPPTRDDKESTSFSSSSKATRDLGKSESAWSGKGPSLKAIPVVATTSTKEEEKRSDHMLLSQLQAATETDLHQVSSQTTKATPSSAKQNSSNVDTKSLKDKVLEKKVEKKLKEEKPFKDAIKEKEPKQSKADKEKEHLVALTNIKTTAAGKQSSSTQQTNNTLESPTLTPASAAAKPNRKKNTTAATTPTTPSSREEKQTAQKPTIAHASVTSPSSKVQQKRTPVYNQKAAQKQIELKETTTTSHKKKSPFSYTFGAFSVENEKSIYSFDKDDDDAGANKPITKPVFRRQSRRDSHPEDMTPSTPTPTPRASPAKKRNAGGASAVDKPHKDAANASQSSSVSLTLSPAENCKLVKVSLEAEQQNSATANKTKSGKFKNKLNASTKQPAETTAADSDSDGHTFYIPLQGTGTGGLAEGGIQGVAVKLGREGPEGPNQKVIMHATLVTKAQMGQNSKPLPDSMNASEIVKNLLISSGGSSTVDTTKKSSNNSLNAAAVVASTSSAAAAINSASNSLKSVPIGTVQPRFKGTADPAATNTAQPSTSTGASGGSGLVRVNSNSSLFSGSAKSRHGNAGPVAVSIISKKFKDDTPIKMSNNTAFPRHDDPTQMVEAPIFRPTEKEFSDPMDFIERITPIAARFGICKIIPPAVFKPECRISDEMRFTAYNQYVHKMLHRWGPSAKELSAIKKYLATQSIVMNHPPWIGGMEVDLPRLYHTVQELGGLKEVIEKKKWARVAEEMCIPKLAQDRVTKLDDIYCKYLLPYDTLSPTERQKLFDEVEADWAKREARARRNADRFVNTESVSNEEDDVSSDDDEESEEEVDGVSMECIVKGRSMPLSQFYRIARNTMTLWFKNTEPTVNEVEAEFWRHVAVRDSHVCVHSGSIDSSGWGYGFPSPGPKGKGSNYARHPWNLKVLTNNPGSVLRSLGPVMGVTVPTLHVGMLFSACCWYRDPHGLSWIEYLHTGASKLWYGIPDDQSANFRAALTSLIPTHCQNKTIWLPCDTVMVPPHMLTDRGVSLCRIEQKPGEFIVVFPRAYTSSLATGYVVSESVYFATNSWLDLAKEDFRDIHDSCEPAMFSLEQLLFALGSDQRVSPDTLQQMLPMLNEVFEKETAAREQLKAAGVTSTEKVPNEKGSKSKKQHHVKSIESECDLCRANLYISMVRTDEGNVYCLQHALKNLNNGNIQAKQCKLIFAYHIEDIENLIKNLNDKIQQKRSSNSNKKSK